MGCRLSRAFPRDRRSLVLGPGQSRGGRANHFAATDGHHRHWDDSGDEVLSPRRLSRTDPLRQTVIGDRHSAGIESPYTFFAPNVPESLRVTFEIQFPDKRVAYELPRGPSDTTVPFIRFSGSSRSEIRPVARGRSADAGRGGGRQQSGGDASRVLGLSPSQLLRTGRAISKCERSRIPIRLQLRFCPGRGASARARVTTKSSRLWRFLFPRESDSWVAFLRIGLGLQLILYCLSARPGWIEVFAGDRGALSSRRISETLIALQSALIPRVDWLLRLGTRIGVQETAMLWMIWNILPLSAVLLVAGVFCRPAAITAGSFIWHV